MNHARTTRHRATRAIAGLATVALLAACADGGDDTTAGSEDDTTAGSEDDTTDAGAADADPAEEGTAADGAGTLRYGTVAAGGGDAVVDPHGSLFNESDWLRHTAIYDVLTVPGADGDVEPWLAESWETNDDATSWTFTLRDDAVFSDGAPVTAEDVAYSVGRMVELAAENGDRAGPVDAAATEVVDERTVVFTTTEPDATLPRVFAGTTFIVPDGTQDFTEPSGSGAYTLTTLDGQAATLEANTDWWGGTPRSSTLEVRGFAEPSALAAAITSGEIDVAAGVEPATARAAQDDNDLQVIQLPGAASYPLLLRIDAEPFDRPEVREAIKLAIDREQLVETVLLGFGTPGVDLANPNDPSFPDDLTPPAHDPETARSLLADAGLGDGFAMELHTTGAYPQMQAAAPVIAEQLAEVGIDVEVVPHPPETYWSEVYTQQPAFMGFYSDVGFPTWVRQTTLSASGFNETGWQDDAFETDFRTAMAETDAESRHDILGDLQLRLADEGGWIVWGYGDGLVVADAEVAGLPEQGGFARYRLEGVGRG